MSAFLCSDATFDLLADYAARRRTTVYTCAGTDASRQAHKAFNDDYANLSQRAPQVAKILRYENVRSLEARYGAQNAIEMGANAPYRYRPVTIDIRPELVLQQIRCLSYQSCETSDWEDTLAHAILEAIEHEAIREITAGQPWTLDEQDVRPKLQLPALTLVGA